MNQLINLKPQPNSERINPAALGGTKEARPRRRVPRWVWLALLFAVAVGAGMYFARPAAWRAVFLTNNQVYFGKFRSYPFQSAIRLENVYYLQISQIQPAEGAQPELKIIKLGQEVHGPADYMVIPKGQILFWEELRPDSPVVQVIQSSEKR